MSTRPSSWIKGWGPTPPARRGREGNGEQGKLEGECEGKEGRGERAGEGNGEKETKEKETKEKETKKKERGGKGKGEGKMARFLPRLK